MDAARHYLVQDPVCGQAIYELGTGRPVLYRDGDVFFRYSDGSPVLYAARDAEDKERLYAFAGGPPLNFVSEQDVSELTEQLFPELSRQKI
jgi:hypothetical protein